MGLAGYELIFLLLVVLPTIVALVDVLRSKFNSSYNKLIWVIVILFLNVIGALLYLIIGRNQRIA